MIARVLALLFAVSLLLAGGAQLAGSLYDEVSHSSRWQNDLRRSAAAAEVAATLQLPPAPSLRGRIAAVDGEAEALMARYASVLRDAPASGYRWTELAQALAWLGRFDATFDLAVARAQALAPRSPASRLALADLSWRFATQLSPEQAQALFPSFAATMQDLGQRERLLDRIVRARRQNAFCAEYGPRFTGGRWCAAIEGRLAACANPEALHRSQQRWCRRVEALP